MKYIYILLFLLIICTSYIERRGNNDNCQVAEKAAAVLERNAKPRVLQHDTGRVFPIGVTESTGRDSQSNGKGNSNRIHRSSGYSGRIVTFIVTAYTKNDAGMNGKGITASGTLARHMHTIAASRGYRFGQQIYIPELGILTVEDRGGRIRGNHIDLYLNVNREEARRFGVRKMKGVVLND